MVFIIGYLGEMYYVFIVLICDDMYNVIGLFFVNGKSIYEIDIIIKN